MELANGQVVDSDLLSLIGAAVTVLVAAVAGFFSAANLRSLRRNATQITEEARTLDEGASTNGVGGALHHVGSPPDVKEHLRQYHEQGLAQSRVSFWFSLAFAAAGFVVIATALLGAESDVALTEQGRAFLSLVAGTIVEAVAGLFFVQSNRARRVMVDFFDRLRIDRKLEESLQLANAVEDEGLRSRLQAMLALTLADAKSSPGALSAVYGKAIQPDEPMKEP